MIFRDALVAMRPQQWIKNGFVLVGTLFGHRWASGNLLDAGLALVAFCLASSAVYLYNDWIDRAADRRHPTKRFRPIAAGRLSGAQVAVLAMLVAGGAYMLASLVGPALVFLVSAYLGLNIAYTLWLKQVVIADVFAISFGFQLRLLAGTVGLGIPPSHWLMLCGFALTLLLALGKRRGELVAPDAAGASRSVLGNYSIALLDQMLGICATLTLAAYGLYAISPGTAVVHGAAHLPFTVPIVTYGVFRYLYVLRIDDDGDPSRLLFADRHLLATAILWLAAVLVIMR